jgi:hypothetical protein
MKALSSVTIITLHQPARENYFDHTKSLTRGIILPVTRRNMVAAC